MVCIPFRIYVLVLFCLLVAAGSAYAAPRQQPEVGIVVHGATTTLPSGGMTVAQQTAVPIPMSENFEGSWPNQGWRLVDRSTDDGGDFLWGKSACHPFQGTAALRAFAGGLQGARLDCASPYPNNANSFAVYGPFDLSQARAARVSFYMYGQTTALDGCPDDYLFIGESTNGNDFEGDRYCGLWTGGREGNGYVHLWFDIKKSVGQSQVWFAFNFQSDAAKNDIGFTVDTIKLEQLRVTFLPAVYDSPQVIIENGTK